MTLRISAAIVLAILLGGFSASQVKEELTEAEAIQIAESFVVENGYTDVPPREDKSMLSFESIDSPDPPKRLRQRYNTLQRKAHAVGNGNLGTGGWTIVFRYNPNNEELRRIVPDFEDYINAAGRAVTMKADGSDIRMQHQDIYLTGLRVIKSESN